MKITGPHWECPPMKWWGRTYVVVYKPGDEERVICLKLPWRGEAGIGRRTLTWFMGSHTLRLGWYSDALDQVLS